MARHNSGPKLVWLNARCRFYVSWYEKGKLRKRSTGHSDFPSAQKFYAEFLTSFLSLADGTRPQEFRVADALAYYAEHHAVNTVDPSRIAYALDRLIEFWGDRFVSEIRESTCNEYAEFRRNSRPEGIADSTIRRELGTLKAALEFCVRDRKLTHSVHIPLPAKPPARDRWLSHSEAARLLWEARRGGRNSRQYLPLFIQIALYTGARTEAILSLTWDRVDLQRGRIDFQLPGRRITKKRRPKVPISAKLLPFLRYAYLRRTSDDGPVLHDQGKPLKRIIRGFKAAAERANLIDVVPHTLRHTCATWLAQDGIDLWQIAGFLGQDVETTSRHYAHHAPEFMAAAVRSTERHKGKQVHRDGLIKMTKKGSEEFVDFIREHR